MATAVRQPFAPLDGARIQNLTSLKNRQNAIVSSGPSKRKAADSFEADDLENFDPAAFTKRSKGANSPKPSFLLTKLDNLDSVSCTSFRPSPKFRAATNSKSPATGLSARPSPKTAPAGRSPTRGKRSGILSASRRRSGGYGRVDPPSFGLSASSKTSSARSAPFSLDAALKGTISDYGRRSSSSAALDFQIHEDTPDQEMTNMLQHNTCILDISSDEESELRRQRELAEDKENVPPPGDISQRSTRSGANRTRLADEDCGAMAEEKPRTALGEMDPKGYYGQDCDEHSVFLVQGDEVDEEGFVSTVAPESQANGRHFEFAPQLRRSAPAAAKKLQRVPEEGTRTVEELMRKSSEEEAPAAAVLEPVEGTGESFEVWESGSFKDENEAPAPASP